MKQNRFKSPVVWTTVTGAVIVLLGQWGLWDFVGIKPELIQNTIVTIILTLISFGILNNPTNKEEF